MIPERDRIKTVMTTAEIAAAMEGGDYSAEMLLQHLVRRYNELQDRAESWRMSSVCRAKDEVIARLESEIEHHKHDAKAWSAVAKGYLGERDDARAELERRANARAIHAMTPQERFALMFQQKPTDD